jgi:SsrA-binding protein
VGRKPQVAILISIEPAIVGESVETKGCRPFSRAANIVSHDPGAHAPGFMLTPASQAKTCAGFVAKEEKVLAANRAAFHNYHISDKYEAGLVLTGTEVKSAMDGRVQLKEAYISVRDGEAWLFNAHISPYSHGNRENHDPLRTRKLLLHKREISRLDEATAKQGMTLVPTQLYLKNGRIKVEVGVARGKKLYDKREAELKRTVERETRAQLKERNR